MPIRSTVGPGKAKLGTRSGQHPDPASKAHPHSADGVRAPVQTMKHPHHGEEPGAAGFDASTMTASESPE